MNIVWIALGSLILLWACEAIACWISYRRVSRAGR